MVLGEEVDADADDDADEGRERLRVDFILMSRTGYLLGVDILTAVSEMQSNARDPVPVVDKSFEARTSSYGPVRCTFSGDQVSFPPLHRENLDHSQSWLRN